MTRHSVEKFECFAKRLVIRRLAGRRPASEHGATCWPSPTTRRSIAPPRPGHEEWAGPFDLAAAGAARGPLEYAGSSHISKA